MDLSSACQEILQENRDILMIILIGSRARGDFKKYSDYDLVFITKKGKTFEIERNYENLICEKTKIEDSISVHLWNINRFREEHKFGNSFVYCTLRDGKRLASRFKLDLNLPRCKKSVKNRLDIAKENLQLIKSPLEFRRKKKINERRFWGLELEKCGYCAMHLCWAVCMMNGFCPVSKYTALKESKKYFTKREFDIIKKSYKFYLNSDFYRRINRMTLVKYYVGLNKIIKRLEKVS